MIMQKCTGPECPGCGSARSEVVDRRQGWTAPNETRRCLFCDRRWQVQVEDDAPAETVDPPVIYHTLRCPRCSSDRTTTTSTRKPLRYHKCHACSHRFKSMESQHTTFS